MNKEDELIQKLFNKVEEKKQRIEKLKSPDYKTNLQFSWDETVRNNINLNTINNVGNFVSILGSILRAKSSHDEACKVLGVKTPFKWQNYSLEDWQHDIKIKVANINIKAEKDELKKLEVQLNDLVSPEMQRKLKLAAIAKQLDD